MKIDHAFTDEELSEIELEDQATAERRLQTYSNHALKMGLPIDGLFINHPAFVEALSGLDRVFQLSTEVDMPHGMRLIGPTGSGKTSLLRYFLRSLPPSSLFAQGLGAVYLRVCKRPSVNYLVSSLLRCYGYPVRRISAESLEPRINVVLEAIRQKGTRVIIFDEAQNLASAIVRRGAQDEGTSPTDFIRQLMDEARVGIVLAGPQTLDDIAQLDDALESRAVGRFHLQNFKYDKFWLALTKRFVRQCDWFDIAIFMDQDINRKLHEITLGNLRAMKRLITESVLVAAQQGATAVDALHVQKSYEMIYGVAAQKANPYDLKAA
nr:TniB family NTP-binding protein [Rhodoferax sp.]